MNAQLPTKCKYTLEFTCEVCKKVETLTDQAWSGHHLPMFPLGWSLFGSGVICLPCLNQLERLVEAIRG